jgi:hypothetical protein
MNFLASIPEIGHKLFNTAKSLGPLIISQSDKASEAYQRHLARIAQVDSLKELLSNEIKTRGEVRKTLLERYVDSLPEERVRIERDIEFVDGTIRQVHIAMKSLSYNSENSIPPNTEPQKPIEDHWIDKFSELARKRNEEWRVDLLARALACEAATPGSVSPRILWLIGNMEESLFKALSDLLDLCVWMSPNNSPVLPHSIVKAFDRVVANSNITVGVLVFQLGDLGVIADHLTSRRQYIQGHAFTAKYNQEIYLINPKQNIEITGILFTPLGDSIARFFNPTWNSNGLSVFRDWIESISPETAEVISLLSPQSA